MCTQTFYCINKAHFLSIYNVVNLKIKSRSPKSKHFFALSWWCICTSLVKFQPLVKEIVCTQTFYCIKKKNYKYKRAITPRELAPSPYFPLCRYILLISMCPQTLMNIHHCIFKILGKTSVADGHTDRWTDNVKTVRILPTPHKQSLLGYNYLLNIL